MLEFLVILGINAWFECSNGIGAAKSPRKSSVRLGGQQQLHRKRRKLSFYFSTLYLIKNSDVEWKTKHILQFDFICYELADLFGNGSRVCRDSEALAIHQGDIKHNGFLLLCCLQVRVKWEKEIMDKPYFSVKDEGAF